jgi:hypothetical protein
MRTILPGGPAPSPTIGGIDALIALQGKNDNQERRRAVGRGKVALDLLDELKVELWAAHWALRPPSLTPCWPRSSFAWRLKLPN